MKYTITLKEQQLKPHQITSLHLMTGFGLLGVGAFTCILGNTYWIQKSFQQLLISASILGSILIVYSLFVLYFTFFKNKLLANNKVNLTFKTLHKLICGAAALIFLLSQWWLAGGITIILALANLVSRIVALKAQKPLLVTIDEMGITLPAISRKSFLAWEQVEKVIIKHGNITIDCVNNTLYQWAIQAHSKEDQDIEAFSSAYIAKNKVIREDNDW
jgi:hypothetical protein